MQSHPRPPTFDADDTDARIRSWVEALKNCDFAGQIALSEKELKSLSPRVRKEFETTAATAQSNALRVVFSVNAAYYATDGGFWTYVCECLGCEDTPQQESKLGRQIEESLIYFGFLERSRYGPFRCVGPLLEQTGVTLRSMQKFADVLRQIADRQWDRLRSIGFHEFRRSVETLAPGSYLGLFLKDESLIGWKYARAVATSISQHERGILSWKELQELPGFRPGFWNVLNSHLDISVPDGVRSRPQRAPLPRLIFDPVRQQVQLAFDHGSVERREYRFDGELVTASRWPLIHRDDFRRLFRVLNKQDDHTWREHQVIGFTPHSSEPFAIFHQERGYIPNHAPVPFGSCYLLAPYGTALPESLQCLTDFEHVGIQDASYVFWQVQIDSTSDLRSLGYTQERLSEELISWAGAGSRLLGALEPDNIFIGKLPPIRITHAHLFHQNRVALLVQLGPSPPERIYISGNSETEEIQIPSGAPVSGRIWIEPLGRQRVTDSVNFEYSLTFFLLPECTIRWPYGLFSPDDCPRLSFEGPAEISVNFPECSPVGPHQWQAPPRLSFLDGTLRTQQGSIILGRPLFRAEFVDERLPNKAFLEQSEFDFDFSLRLRGLPNSPIRIGLSNRLNTTAFDLPYNFDAGGLKRISSFAFRDAFKECNDPVRSISIWDGRRWISTGSAILNLDALAAWLFADEWNPEPTWFPLVEQSFAGWLKTVRGAFASHTAVAPFSPQLALPPSVLRWTDEVELMTSVFADYIGEGSNPFATAKTDHLESDVVKALRWIWAARSLIESASSEQTSDAGSLISEYPQWVPPLKAWQQRMQGLLQTLRLQQDLELMIEEWAAEVRAPLPLTLNSQIARQTGGRELTEAYLCSRQTKDQAAYLLTDAIEQGSASGLVLDLALLLKNIIRVRNNIGFQPPVNPVHKKLQLYFSGLSQLALGQSVGLASEGELATKLVAPNKLPIHEHDIALLRRAIGASDT